MDEDGLTLFPELPEPGWEVTFTWRRPEGAEPLVPCAPGADGVIVMYCAGGAQAITEVQAGDAGEAEAVAREACSGLPWVAKATAEARPAGDGTSIGEAILEAVRNWLAPR